MCKLAAYIHQKMEGSAVYLHQNSLSPRWNVIDFLADAIYMQLVGSLYFLLFKKLFISRARLLFLLLLKLKLILSFFKN